MRRLTFSDRKILLILPVVALAATLIGGLGAFISATSDVVAPNVTALGVPVGGLTRSEAASRLQRPIADLVARPLRVSAPDQYWETNAGQLGLTLDATEVADDAFRVGHTGDLFTQLRERFASLRDGTQIASIPVANQATVERSLDAYAAEIERPARDAGVGLNADGTVWRTNAQVGRSLDRPASRERIVRALLNGDPSAELAVRETQPAIIDAQVEAAATQLAAIVGNGNGPLLTLNFDTRRWSIPRSELLNLISVSSPERTGAPFRVSLNDSILRSRVRAIAAEIDQDVQDGRFQWLGGGKLKVLTESHEGRTVEQEAAVQQALEALKSGSRELALPVSVQGSAVPTSAPESLSIVELIDQGSTSFAGGTPEKIHNIRLAAQRLNGVVVPPGGTFSFNDSIGPTTLDAGFTWGFGITSENGNARTVPSVAGGICQVATTLFQPVFWAGFPLEERYWHLYWIPAYTSRGVVGLDVTVDADARLDFRWSNPTNNYVLIQASTDADKVTFALYGKKPQWTVTVDPARIDNRVQPDSTPQIQEEPLLAAGRRVQVESAREGFDVEVTRHVVPMAGQERRDLTLRSTYQPSRTVTLVGTGGASLQAASAQTPTP